MSRAELALALLLVTVPLAGCVADDPAPEADPASTEAGEASISWFEKVHAPDEIAERVEGYDDLEAAEVERIGTSLEERPIHLVEVGEGPVELWIVGRQHGDEPTGAEAILLAIEALADPDTRLPDHAPPVAKALQEHREQLLDRVTFLFVPVGNPDGAAAYQRTTALGQDPNRDHFLFTQPASDALREAFWDHTPDACLDLHNMGEGDTDYDAYGPEGPFMEDEPYQRMREEADRTVRQVDAAGANGGTFNENYRAPPPADDEPNPTAFHPGTHDMFCTARGAPGWTPEGAIPGGENGVDTHPFEWSTRLHLATVAGSALHWAGAYEATEPRVVNAHEGTADGAVASTVDVRGAEELVLQAVWRQTATEGDHNPAPASFTVTTPDGTTHEGRQPVPEAWTSTVHLDDPEPGSYELAFAGTAREHLELRAYVTPPGEPLVDVTRNAHNLTVTAADEAPGPVDVRVSDVADAPGSAVERPDAATRELNGTVEARVLADAHATLAPGETLTLPTPRDWADRGPYSAVAATEDGRLHAVVEDAYNSV